MRGAADKLSPQIEHIRQNCGDFASDPRNINLGVLCADGVKEGLHIQ